MGRHLHVILCILIVLGGVHALPQPKVTECRSMMDLVLVVDGSDSITAADYQKQREALTDLARHLHLGPREARMGLVVYSSSIAQKVPLTDDRNVLLHETTNLIHPRDGTNTALGIATMRQLFNETGRPELPWVCIVITDGLSKDPPLTKMEATLAKEMGINMFAVGISHFIAEDELKNIASTPEQFMMLKTFDQLLTSLQKLMKVVCPCPPPPVVPFGFTDDGPRSIGSVRTYGCEPGYQAIGDPTITCTPMSIWSPLKFSCLACPDPPVEFGNGVVIQGLNLLGSVREYKCRDGFASSEPLISTCVAGPEGPSWTTPIAMCSACYAPAIPKNAHLPVPVTSGQVGQVVQFQCVPGFIPTGPVETTCINNKGVPMWSNPVHKCIACGPPPKVDFMVVSPEGGQLVNSIRLYKCIPGFHPTGPIEAICVGDKGATYWRFNGNKCIPCDNPPKLPNALLLVPGDNLVGTIREYQCLKGFQPTGPIKVICEAANGNVPIWTGPEHQCVACIAPPLIQNAILDPLGDTLVGSVRRYQCMKGFVATGPIEVGCITSTGGPMWTAPENTCITCTNPPILPNAILDLKGDNFVGNQRYYSCMEGFVPTVAGPIVIECLAEVMEGKGRAFWGPPSHFCIACPDPPPLNFALLEMGGSNLVGSSRKYVCDNDHFATGPIIITCLPSGQWSVPEHSCLACGPVPKVAYADVLPGMHTIGSVREYVCRPGYVPSQKPIIECIPGPAWTPVEFACVACPDPYPAKYAVLEPGDNLVGSVRRYTCLPGYLNTGDITSTCAVPQAITAGPSVVVPDWSTPVHFCKDCGEPFIVPNAQAIPATKTIGSQISYVCDKGYVPSAPPYSFCMQNAEWSPPEFKCIVCSAPPNVEYATVDGVGDVLVGSRRAYTCQIGYVPTGPVEVTCLPAPGGEDKYLQPVWIMEVKNRCIDCGRPPDVANAYSNMGPVTVGSVRKYACAEGYDLVGQDVITCLGTGLWSKPEFMCALRTTTTSTTPAPVKNNPSVCDDCRMLNGVGYINHPLDCSQFVQCFYSAHGGIEAVYKPCSFGQFWDQSMLTCRPAGDVDCPKDRCLDPRLHSYKHHDSRKCCAYWECQNGRSVPKCCGENYRYVGGKGCEYDPTCESECPWEDMFPECDKRPLVDISSYEQHIGDGFWLRMPCAPGTAFNVLDCDCTLHIGIVPGYVCRPELLINFDENSKTLDKSGKNVYVINEGVVPWQGGGFFNGSSRLLINRFSNTAFHGDLVIKFRYKEKLDVPTGKSLQALVTNGDCGDDPSIIIAKMPGFVLCGAKTNVPKSFALPTIDKEWKEVIYIHNEQKLEGKVCGASYNKWSLGPIQATHCGLQIGYGTKLANFVGLMDDISVYQCRPPEDVINVYGGRLPQVPIAMTVH